MNPLITFHGAAGCVTGSCAEIRAAGAHLLVDCGMFQGSKTLKALNYEPFPFDPASIDAVLLTHAHIDHSGLLPKLRRGGFRGPVYATAATRDLCAVMLADAAGIQESEVRELNRRNQRRGRPLVEPIYTGRDARNVMEQFERIELGESIRVTPEVTATFWEAGHILGSASIELQIPSDDRPLKLLFSGDLGPGGSEFVADPQAPSDIDHLIVETTYGDRQRTEADAGARRQLLAEALREAHAAGGPLLAPSFAVERTQELIADLLIVMESGAAPAGDIFLDSPLAIEATEVFLERGWNPEIGRNPFLDVRPKGRLRFLRKPWESDGLDRLKGWHVILAASGMCEAGRVRKHLKRLLWRKEATVLLPGFQAVGTLGRLLADGAERVTIQGDEVRVRARIRSLDVYSGHADARALTAWAVARQPVSGSVFLNHGEPQATAGLRERLAAAGFARDKLLSPNLDETFRLSAREALPQANEHPRIAPRAAATLDWHNARADFLLSLNQALEKASSDAEREAVLRGLKSALPVVDRGQRARADLAAT